MFSNFFYFIVALLIYSTYQPSEATHFSTFQSLVLFLFLLAFYTFFCWRQFQRLNRKISTHGMALGDARFNSLLVRLSVLAIFVFALDIYALNLSMFTSHAILFSTFPTLQAILFVLLFVGYLSILWACAHKTYQRLYGSNVSKRAYIGSNISFSMPVLLPWFVISGLSDIIHILPFDTPKRFLAHPAGEVVYFLVFLFFVALLGPLMIQKFWKCRPLKPGTERRRIEDLCRSVNLGYRDILSWPIFEGRIITAGVMGLVKRFRYILVTDSLLALLDPQEVDAVIAHEIGHVKHRHLVFYLFFFVGYMILSFVLLDLIVYAMIYLDPVIGLFHGIGFDPVTVTSFLFSIFIIVTFLVYFRFVFGYFMRNFERQADAYVYALFDTAAPLMRTLHKISITGRQSPDKPNWHHFSIRERIDFLQRCETDRSLVKRHAAKIRNSFGVYLVGLMLMGVVGYQLSYGEAGTTLNAHFFEKIVAKELEKKPEDADLLTLMGDLYFNQKRYADAAAQYETAIKWAHSHARALNNLAWLYATCEEASFRNPQRALLLAKKAAALEREPHILDTLAESYFVNGDIASALETEKEALAIAQKNKQYYREQVKRFEAALANIEP